MESTYFSVASRAVVGLLGLLAYPWVTRAQWGLAPNSKPWLMAQLYADGPAERYLETTCDKIPYTLCRHLHTFPPAHLLWGDGTPGSTPLGTSDSDAIWNESGKVVIGTLLTYPGWAAELAMRHFADQLLTFQMEIPDNIALVPSGLPKNTEFAKGLLSSRQTSSEKTDPLGRYVEKTEIYNDLYYINRMQAIAVISSTLAAIALCRRLWRRGETALLWALAGISVGLLANAFTLGVLSGVYARYGGRVIWLLPFWCLAALRTLLRSGRPPCERQARTL